MDINLFNLAIETVKHFDKFEDERSMLSCLGMAIEDWSAKHDKDPKEMLSALLEVMTGIIKQMGDYKDTCM